MIKIHFKNGETLKLNRSLFDFLETLKQFNPGGTIIFDTEVFNDAAVSINVAEILYIEENDIDTIKKFRENNYKEE